MKWYIVLREIVIGKAYLTILAVVLQQRRQKREDYSESE